MLMLYFTLLQKHPNICVDLQMFALRVSMVGRGNVMSSAIDPELSEMGLTQSNTHDPRRIFSGLIGLTYDTVGERAIESHLIPFAGCSQLFYTNEKPI